MNAVIALSLLGLLFSALVLLWTLRTQLSIFHPGTILIALAAVDTFIPGVVWGLTGIPEPPSWKSELRPPDLALGLGYYLAFYALLVPCLIGPRLPRVRPEQVFVRSRRLWIGALVALGFSLLAFSQEVAVFGGLTDWLWGRAVHRWTPLMLRSAEPDVLELVVLRPPWRVIFNAFVLCGFFLRDRLRPKLLYSVVLPGIGLLLAILTFSRGSVLVFVLGLAFGETLRSSGRAPGGRGAGPGLRRLRSAGGGAALIAVGVVLFIGYGLVREVVEKTSWNLLDRSAVPFYRVFAQGEGLDAVSHILARYGRDIPFWGGKTYYDMSLRLVPRMIYKNKPEWYGTDDITRRMGWVETSQSAVTMPGEAFANFGWWGLALAPILGTLLFALTRLCVTRSSSPVLFVYSGSAFYVFFICNWFSFTGIMNQFEAIVLVWLGLRWVSGPHARQVGVRVSGEHERLSAARAVESSA